MTGWSCSDLSPGISSVFATSASLYLSWLSKSAARLVIRSCERSFLANASLNHTRSVSHTPALFVMSKPGMSS